MINSGQAYTRAIDLIQSMDHYNGEPPFVLEKDMDFNKQNLKCINARLDSLTFFHPEAVDRAWAYCTGTER